MQISETTTHSPTNSTSLGVLFPVQELAVQDAEQDLLTRNQSCGENHSGSSASLNQALLLWNSLKDLSDEDFALGLEQCEWLDTLTSLQSCYQQRRLERRKLGSESLLCPTPTASAGGMEYRQAGGSKFSTWCRNQGLVNGDSQVLNADKVESLQGFQVGHTRVIGGCQSDHPDAISDVDSCLEKPLSQPKLTSPLPSCESLHWGADGVGRGNCAGLNIWCLVGVPEGLSLIGVKDSKLTKAHQREQLAQAIRAKCIVGIGVAIPREIDELGIDKAEELALSRAIAYVQAQGYEPGEVMGDLKMPPAQVSTQQVKSADAVYLETSAASVIAKYTLDLYWSRVDQYYPDYGFTAHAGYVKPVHMSAIKQHGLIAGIHRLSYKPCKEKAAIDVAANQLNAQGHYTMVAIANTAKKIEDLAVEIASQQEQLKVVQQVYKDDVIGFEERKLKKAEREWKSAESAYKFVTAKIKKLIATLELCQSMPLDSSFTHQHYGEGVLQGFLFDHRGVVMASVNFAEKGITEVSPHEIKVVSGSVKPDYSGFPSEEMIEFKRSKAIWIRDCILAVKSEADYQALRKLPDFTRDQLNWVRKNVLTDEQQKAYTDAIKNNPLPKPVGVGDIVIRPTGEIYGEVKIVQVRGVAIEREGEITKLSWDEFELLQLAKQQTTNDESAQTEEPIEENEDSEDEEITREMIDVSVERLRVNLYNLSGVIEENLEVTTAQNEPEIIESPVLIEAYTCTEEDAVQAELVVKEVQAPLEPDTPLVLPIAGIRRDGGTQQRERLDLAHVAKLVEQLNNAESETDAKLDLVIVFYDGSEYWLADGFHRCKAYESAARREIPCKVIPGTRRDAVLYSVGANADHKAVLPRTRADKRRAVLTLLNDPEWQHWSDRAIAKQCSVSNVFVSDLRKKGSEQLPVNINRDDSGTGENAAPVSRTYTRKGKTSTMQVSGINQGRTNKTTEQEVAAVGQSLGLSGRESQQLPDTEPNADIPLDNEPTALYNCCSQAELRVFCKEHTQEAIAQLRSLDWEKRFELRGIWAEFEAWLATCAFHRQIDSQGILTLEAVDSKAKIKWLEAEVARLQGENDELRARLIKPVSTRTDEWYTPPEYIEMAREVMGGIDLDPASNELAQSWIQAKEYFTKDDDGLRQEWEGRIWCNPPYGRAVEDWLDVAIGGYQDGIVKSAILLLNRTGAAWYKASLKGVTAICEVHKRIAFIDENSNRQPSPRYYNDFLYLGKDVEKFIEVFSAIGDIRVMQPELQQEAA